MNVDNVKLVDPKYLASIEAAEEAVEYAVQQAAGWGTSRSDSILLRVAASLERAQIDSVRCAELEVELDETKRKLKGAQLQQGQLKKKVGDLNTTILQLKAEESS
jgi:hypothetical protein